MRTRLRSDKRNYGDDSSSSKTQSAGTNFVAWLGIFWGAVIVVEFVVWSAIWLWRGAFGNDGQSQFERGFWINFRIYLLPNGWDVWHGTALYFAFSLIFLISVVVVGYKALSQKGFIVVLTVVSLLAIASLTQMWRGVWDNDTDWGRSYMTTTSYVVRDVNNAPSLLNPLLDGAKNGAAGSGCDKVSKHDVPSCINSGTIKQSWTVRKGSLSGATYIMSNRGGGGGNTTLLQESMTYVYSNGGYWSAIRDGQDKTPMFGVIAWDGRSEYPGICRFDGKYKLDMSFAGKWGHSLKDYLAAKYPSLLFEMSDIWGYCDGPTVGSGEPIVVIPVMRLAAYNQSAVLKAAGVITVKGSADGSPHSTYYSDVKASQFHGPVYPLSLAITQRQELQWSAGRGNLNNQGFGFDSIDPNIESANTSDYLLQDTTTGRLYWVTPVQPHNSSTKEADAYTLIPADEVHNDSLNRQTVYVLDDRSPQIAKLTDLVQVAANYLTAHYPTLLQAGGKIAELNPVTDEIWQIIVDFNGQQKFSIMVPINDTNMTQLEDINPALNISAASVPGKVSATPSTAPTPSAGNASTPAPSGTACAKPVDQMSKKELVDCINAAARRLGENQAAA